MNLPKELIEAFSSNKVSFFIGAGLSQSVGYPSWKNLLNLLIDHLKTVSEPSKEDIEEYLKILDDPNKYLLLAEVLREKLGRSELERVLKEKFFDFRPDPHKNHKLIISLPYNYIITTNYDLMLEDAFAFVNRKNAIKYYYDDSKSIADHLWSGTKFILKAHGDSENSNKIILTERDYRNLIYSQLAYNSVLQVMFTTNTVFFLGASLNDPEIKLFLGYLRNAYHEGGPKHFALINKNEMSKVIAERWRKDYGIQILYYDPKNNHEEINLYLNEISKSVAL